MRDMSGPVKIIGDKAFPAWKLRSLIATRELSPREAVNEAVERAETINPVLNNIMTLCADSAAEQAAKLEKHILQGDADGPLLGVPLTVKDLLWTKGIRTTAGSRLFKDWTPDVDALAVQRVKRAGGIIIGKGNTSEFGLFWRTRNRLMGECLNPWNSSNVAGGSSGGDAASVASGVCPVALGTDRGGSGRIPASWCGVVGLQSGFGILESKGSVVKSLFFSGVAPLATCVRDLATLFQVLSGSAESRGCCRPLWQQALELRGDEFRATGYGLEKRRMVVGWYGGKGGEGSLVEKACMDALVRLGEAGAEIRAVGWPDEIRDEEAYWLLNDADRSTFLGARIRAHDGWEEEVCDYVYDRLSHGEAASSTDVIKALMVRQEYQRNVSRLFEETDFVLTPTVPIVAPSATDAERVSRDQITRFTWQVNFADLTAVSIPVAMVSGLPVGLQVIGRKGDELRIFKLCELIEKLCNG